MERNWIRGQDPLTSLDLCVVPVETGRVISELWKIVYYDHLHENSSYSTLFCVELLYYHLAGIVPTISPALKLVPHTLIQVPGSLRESP